MSSSDQFLLATRFYHGAQSVRYDIDLLHFLTCFDNLCFADDIDLIEQNW